MKVSPNAVAEINAWLESEQDYARGVNLFVIHGKNQTLKRLFAGKEHKYKNKLLYELTKVIGQPFVPGTVKVDKAVNGAGLIPAEFPEDIGEVGDTVPKVIARLIKEYSKRYNDRSMAHGALKAVPPDNRPENVASRQKLLESISEDSSRMEELFEAKQLFEKEGTLPDEEKLFPVKTSKTEGTELTREETIKKLDNLKKSLNKDLSLLNFQSLKKQKEPNPMPEGPKRKVIEKRIGEKKALIGKLSKQLDGLN